MNKTANYFNFDSTIICICRTIMPFSAQHILAILFGDMVHSDRVTVRKRQSESVRERENERARERVRGRERERKRGRERERENVK